MGSLIVPRLRKLLLLAGFALKGGVWYARKLGVRVGDGCRIYITSWGSEPFLIRIGDRVTITSGVRFLTHDGATWLIREGGVRYQRYGPITVGDDVFIGVNSIIMPGVDIGSRVVVGAGSVVVRNVPDDVVVVGTPARIVSTFDGYRQKIMATCAMDSELSASDYQDRVQEAIRIQNEKA